MEEYRLFYTYRTKDLNLLTVTGMDMINRKLFSVLVYSAKDSIDLAHPLTPELPPGLEKLLWTEKSLIDKGYYDLTSWNTNVLN